MDIDQLTLKEAREAIARGQEIAAALSGQAVTPAVGVTSEGLNIVILDRGFVYVGNVSIEGDWIVVTNAKNVRRWGTTQGLGELAAKGPQPETKLDMAGTVKAPLRALIGLIACEASSWIK